MKINKKCPICGQELDENNMLKAYFVMRKNWWVLQHLKRNKSLDNFRESCALAGYQLIDSTTEIKEA